LALSRLYTIFVPSSFRELGMLAAWFARTESLGNRVNRGNPPLQTDLPYPCFLGNVLLGR
jgi:hypothetical protein